MAVQAMVAVVNDSSIIILLEGRTKVPGFRPSWSV